MDEQMGNVKMFFMCLFGAVAVTGLWIWGLFRPAPKELSLRTRLMANWFIPKVKQEPLELPNKDN